MANDEKRERGRRSLASLLMQGREQGHGADKKGDHHMTFTELKERTCKVLEGEVTFSKLDFFLLGAVLLLAGICLGLLTAPFTHGISLFSNNGCNNGNNNGNGSGDYAAHIGSDDSDVEPAIEDKAKKKNV